MTTTHNEIIIASRGWSHSSWHESFYPDDLPEDWQLSFYSNEFLAVVVPASEWVGMDNVEVERWAEDVSEEFLFFLEIEDTATNWEQAIETIKSLGTQLGGIILRPLELDSDLAMISTNIISASTIAPTSLLMPDDVVPSATGKDLLKQNDVQCGWNVEQGRPDWMDSSHDSTLTVVQIPGNKNFTARQWRETIEASVNKAEGLGEANVEKNAATKSHTLLLMIESDEPKINDLRTAMMIGDLMTVPASVQQK